MSCELMPYCYSLSQRNNIALVNLQILENIGN